MDIRKSEGPLSYCHQSICCHGNDKVHHSNNTDSNAKQTSYANNSRTTNAKQLQELKTQLENGPKNKTAAKTRPKGTEQTQIVPIDQTPEAKCSRYKFCDNLEGFRYPWGVAVSSEGDVAVAEWGGNCITVMDSQGKRKITIGGKEQSRNNLQNPCGVIFTSGGGHLLVTDSNGVTKYTREGKLIKSVGSTIQRQFDLPAGLAIHPRNNKIYVADSNNHRIEILNQDLSFHGTFGGRGTERGKFHLPWDVAFDSKGLVYVAEGNCRIQKFTPDGNFVAAFGKKGCGLGEISRPASIAIDNRDIIHITDLYNNRISMYTTFGEFLGSHGNQSKESGAGDFNGPCGITATNDGVLYVTDGWNNRVKIFHYH